MGKNLRQLTRILVIVVVGALVLPAGGSPGAGGALSAAHATERQILDDLAAAPVRFVENVGQAHATVRAIAQGPGYSFAFGSRGMRVSLVGQGGLRGADASGVTMMLGFVGANAHADIELRGRGAAKFDYLVGDRTTWRAGLATYRELVYRDLWPGIDVAFSGSRGALKYEFRVQPGADPRQIRLAYSGIDSLSVSSGGGLEIHTKRGVLRDAAPVTYQDVHGWRVDVASRFELRSAQAYGFAVGGYDRTQPLVIDPALDYSTYLGGSADDGGNALAVHGHDAYVVGATASPDMPITRDAVQPAIGGSLDAFVIRLDARRRGAAALEYGTFLGGAFPDAALSVAVNGHDVYVTGLTTSPNFPVTSDAYDPTINSFGLPDGFLARIDTTRSGADALEYSTYLGGGGLDVGLSIALEGHEAYLTGTTTSPNFPVTPDAFQPVFTGFDGFVTRIDTDQEGPAGLIYSTFLGGSGPDSGREIAVREGDAFVAGPSASPDFPVTANAFDPTYNGGLDAVVSRIDTNKPGLDGLEYSTYLGGSGDEDTFTRPGTSIALRGDDVYVSSLTTSPDFPVTENAYDPTPNGGEDAFVTQLDTGREGPDGLIYSTYLGGSGDDIGRGVDIFGDDIYVTGGTFSLDFPVTPNAFQTENAGGRDVFVTRLDTHRGPDGLVYSSYLGGSGDDVGRGIRALADDAYVTGETQSPNFPTTPGAFQPSDRGGQDAFLARLDTRPR
jgi:hypothetical protein